MQTFTPPTRIYFRQQKGTYIVCDNCFKQAVTTFSQILKNVCLNISFLQSEFTFKVQSANTTVDLIAFC